MIWTKRDTKALILYTLFNIVAVLMIAIVS